MYEFSYISLNVQMTMDLLHIFKYTGLKPLCGRGAEQQKQGDRV